MASTLTELRATYDDQVKDLTKYSKILIGHVISIAHSFSRRHAKIPRIEQYCRDQLHIFVDISQIELVWHEYEKHRKNVTPARPSGIAKMIDFLSRVFYFEPFEPSTQAIRDCTPSTNVKNSLQYNADSVSNSGMESAATRRRFRSLRLQNTRLFKEVTTLRQDVEALRKRGSFIEKSLNMHKSRWKRRQNDRENFKTVLKEQKMRNSRLHASLRKSRQLINDKRTIVRRAVRLERKKTQQQVHSLEAQLLYFEDKVVELESEVKKLSDPSKLKKLETKASGKYVDAIRESVYLCARRQVPLHSISTVVAELSKILFSHELSPLPCASTVGNMVREMGILAIEQAVEAILGSQYVNLCWDATSIDRNHINEIHVNTDSGSYVLSVQQIAGGSTKDYVDHITSTLEYSAEVYANFRSLDYSVVLADIKSRITSTLSDRAAVNHCVSREIASYVGHDVLDLNCNVHPLDSLSIAFRKLSREFEADYRTDSGFNGTGTALVNVIQNISKMRYKAKGDPLGMATFFEIAKLDKGLLKRYVGNRFHILFELSGNIYYMRNELLKYLDTACCKGNQYKDQICHDLTLDIVVRQLAVCGLFGKALTGPWMACIYRKADLTNLDTSVPLTYMVEKLKAIIEAPRVLWDMDFCCFDVKDHEKSELSQTVHESLCKSTIDSISLGLAKRTAEEFLKVVERQAERYLPGGALAKLEPEMIVLGTNAPADNIVAESILGLTDNIMRKCPNSTGSYVTSKTSFAVNKTYDWLLTMHKEDRIPKAIAQARAFRNKTLSDRRDVQAEIVQRVKAREVDRLAWKAKKEKANIKELLKNPDTFKDSILSMDDSICIDSIDLVLDIIRCPSILEGKDFVWVRTDDKSDTPLRYRVLKHRKIDGPVRYKALSWSPNETVEDAPKTEFFLYDFVKDMLVGDAWLI